MASPLAGSIRRLVGSAAKGLFLPAVLTRDVPGVIVDPADPPVPDTATFACRAIRENYGVGHRANELVKDGDVNILILQTSLSTTPVAGDRILIPGMGGPWQIVSDTGLPAVSADPANATWECRARGAG